MPSTRPRCGAAAPDLILTQDVCAVCAVPTALARQAACAVDGRARVLSLDAHSVAGILESIRQVGEAAGAGDRADALVASLRARLEEVRSRVVSLSRPRTLVLEWLDPVFVPGHWGPEMVDLAGGENLAGGARERSRQLAWEDLRGLDPDVVVIPPCGYGLDQARAEADAHRERLAAAAPRATADGRVWVAGRLRVFQPVGSPGRGRCGDPGRDAPSRRVPRRVARRPRDALARLRGSRERRAPIKFSMPTIVRRHSPAGVQTHAL
jgi:iron complex transport system substrate-binding protein